MRLRNESEKHLPPRKWIALGTETVLLTIIFLIVARFGLDEPLVGWRAALATAVWTSIVFTCAYALIPARGFYLADFPCGTVGKVIILTVGFVGWPFFIASRRKMEAIDRQHQCYDETIELACREAEKVDREMTMEERFPERSVEVLADYCMNQAAMTGITMTREKAFEYVHALKEIPSVQRIGHYADGEIFIVLNIRAGLSGHQYAIGEYRLVLKPLSKFELMPGMSYALSAELTESHRLEPEMMRNIRNNTNSLYRVFYMGRVDVLVKAVLEGMMLPLRGAYVPFELEGHYPHVS